MVQHPQLCNENVKLDMTRLQELISYHLLVTHSVSTPTMHSHARTMHTTSTGTAAPHASSTPSHTNSTAFEELLAKMERLNAYCQSLREENDRLKSKLNGTTETVVTSKRWQEYANSVIGAESSRATPKYEYNCAHSLNPEWTEGSCNWSKKRTTLLAYIKHLKEKHSEDIRKKAEKDLLPVHSTIQPAESARRAQDVAKEQRKAQHVGENERVARRLIIVDRRESSESSRCDWLSRNANGSVALRRSARLRALPRPNYAEYDTDSDIE